jgi:hypothetical protein
MFTIILIAVDSELFDPNLVGDGERQCAFVKNPSCCIWILLGLGQFYGDAGSRIWMTIRSGIPIMGMLVCDCSTTQLT